jgi:hypothetical protein
MSNLGDHSMPFEIRLRLDHIKHEIVQHIGGYLDNTKDAMRAAVGKAIDGFSWEAEVAAIVHVQLRDILRNAIEGHVRVAVMHNAALKEAVEDAVRKQFDASYGRKKPRAPHP